MKRLNVTRCGKPTGASVSNNDTVLRAPSLLTTQTQAQFYFTAVVDLSGRWIPVVREDGLEDPGVVASVVSWHAQSYVSKSS